MLSPVFALVIRILSPVLGLAWWAALGVPLAAAHEHPFPRPVGEHEWEDHRIVQINKLPPHATLFPFASRDAAHGGAREASPFFRSLDGLWKFSWVRAPADAPEGFESTDFDDSGWDEIPVPGNWEVHGFGRAIYLDERYPFEAE